ncbi:MAG: response regulator transcription factor [Chloroflexi bacterium]|nr:response regulator transcription factor [Chloroflexota bacterium]
MERVRILVVEDHGIVRDGIRLLLQAEPDMEVVGDAADGQSAVEKAAQLNPDVVLMDLGLPGVNGIDATRRIKDRSPQAKVLALTVHDSDDHFFRSLDAGASGYVLKGSASGELLQAIRAAYRDEIYLPPSLGKRLVADYLRRVRFGEERDSYESLSSREREVLRLIAEGHTNQEIASMLTVSPSTVQTHRSRIMEKLNLRSRADLIKYAIRRGVIDLSP